MDEKRAHRRQLMQEMAHIQMHPLDKWQPTVLLDMSASGVSFICATHVEKNARLSVRFSLPGSARLHEVGVEVVHASTNGVPSGYRVGARFVMLMAEAQGAIAEYLDTSPAQVW